MNPQAAIPQIEVKDHVSEGSVAREFVRELEGDLSDAGRYSSQETLLDLKELKQRPLADLQGQGALSDNIRWPTDQPLTDHRLP
jgi:hypothetical protein